MAEVDSKAKSSVQEYVEVQLQKFKNIAPKASLFAFTISFLVIYFYAFATTPAVDLDIADTLMHCLKFAFIFATTGYFLGLFVGERIRDAHMSKLFEDRARRKQSFREELRRREAKLKDF